MRGLGWFAAGFVILCIGCENSVIDRSLIFATHTTIGVELAVSPAETTNSPVSIVLGYKRSEGVLNPVYDRQGINKSDPKSPKYRPDAYSVVAKFQGEIKAKASGSDSAIVASQWFATGQAADNITGNSAFATVMTDDPKIASETRQAAFAQADKELAALANTSEESTNLRKQFDDLMDKPLKPAFKDKYKDTQDYAEAMAEKYSKSWVRVRAEAGNELKALIEKLKTAVE